MTSYNTVKFHYKDHPVLRPHSVGLKQNSIGLGLVIKFNF